MISACFRIWLEGISYHVLSETYKNSDFWAKNFGLVVTRNGLETFLLKMIKVVN